MGGSRVETGRLYDMKYNDDSNMPDFYEMMEIGDEQARREESDNRRISSSYFNEDDGRRTFTFLKVKTTTYDRLVDMARDEGQHLYIFTAFALEWFINHYEKPKPGGDSYMAWLDAKSLSIYEKWQMATRIAARYVQHPHDDEHAEVLAQVCEEYDLSIEDVKKAASNTMQSFFLSVADDKQSKKSKCKKALIALFQNKTELPAGEVLSKLSEFGFGNRNMIYEARTELGIESVRVESNTVWRMSKAAQILISPE